MHWLDPSCLGTAGVCVSAHHTPLGVLLGTGPCLAEPGDPALCNV